MKYWICFEEGTGIKYGYSSDQQEIGSTKIINLPIKTAI